MTQWYLAVLNATLTKHVGELMVDITPVNNTKGRL